MPFHDALKQCNYSRCRDWVAQLVYLVYLVSHNVHDIHTFGVSVIEGSMFPVCMPLVEEVCTVWWCQLCQGWVSWCVWDRLPLSFLTLHWLQRTLQLSSDTELLRFLSCILHILQVLRMFLMSRMTIDATDYACLS